MNDQNPVSINGFCLLCPDCGESSLHQSQVRVYDRGEDDPSTETIVDGGLITQHPRANARNPSRRRQGLRVAFECEHRCGLFWLCIVQHKGQTWLFWEPATQSPEVFT